MFSKTADLVSEPRDYYSLAQYRCCVRRRVFLYVVISWYN